MLVGRKMTFIVLVLAFGRRHGYCIKGRAVKVIMSEPSFRLVLIALFKSI